jgi:hypothetical protein
MSNQFRQSFKYLRSQNLLIPGLKNSAEKHNLRLKENTEIISEVQTNIQ